MVITIFAPSGEYHGSLIDHHLLVTYNRLNSQILRRVNASFLIGEPLKDQASPNLIGGTFPFMPFPHFG